MTDPLTAAATNDVHPFDRAISVRRDDDGAFVGRIGKDYWAFVGQFGGVTAATLLNALLQHPNARGQPLALTVNFAAPVVEGPFRIDLRCVRANRSTQHWSLELLQGDDREPKVSATAVLADKRASFSHQTASPPAIQPIERLRRMVFKEPVPWVQRYQLWFESGGPVRSAEPLSPPGSAFSQFWVADAPDRPIDILSLAAMTDAFFGRIFQVRGAMVPFGTVSLTTYFHSDMDELRTIATPRLVARADAKRFHRSFADQTGELWSPDGRLLASTHQIAYFKA